MNQILGDLYAHQEWADAAHWQAIAAWEAAREDPAIRALLLHIHLVQRYFMFACGDGKEPPEIVDAAAFPSFASLRAYALDSHARVREFVGSISDERLEQQITIPWFQNPPLTLAIREALTQCAMHSQYHRGQNAMRLRLLGGEPPGTDLIVWYWKGRPPADWA